MTMGPGGGSDPGNKGSSRGGGGSAGSGGGSGRGNNTPGHPGNEGRRGNSAPSSDGRGSNTPGHPGNPGRVGNSAPTGRGGSTGDAARDGRGTNTPGSPATRARDAMSRHSRQRDEGATTEGGLVAGEANLGVGEGYSHADAIAERAKTGMVSPREADIARGYKSGKNSAMATQAVGGIVGDVASRATSIPGIGKGTNTAVGAVAGSTVSTPETEYGAAAARSRASNSMAQSAAQAAAGIVGGPVAGYGVGMINAAINDQKTKDIDRMSDAMGFDTPGGAPVGSGNGNRATATATATTPQTINISDAPQATAFEWKPVDIDWYSQGLISMAQTNLGSV